MQIYGPYRVSTSQAAGQTQATSAANRLQDAQPQPAAKSASPVDQLDLSSAATGVNRMAAVESATGGGEIRVDRVADLRRQIADGSYDTPERMEAALDRFLDQYA